MLTQQLNCILLLDYKLRVTKYNINNAKFVEMEERKLN